MLADVPAKPSCLAEAKGSKKCACPVAPDETVVIPCSSVVRPETCGVCSVVSKDGERDGRSCLTVSE